MSIEYRSGLVEVILRDRDVYHFHLSIVDKSFRIRLCRRRENSELFQISFSRETIRIKYLNLPGKKKSLSLLHLFILAFFFFGSPRFLFPELKINLKLKIAMNNL